MCGYHTLEVANGVGYPQAYITPFTIRAKNFRCDETYLAILHLTGKADDFGLLVH